MEHLLWHQHFPGLVFWAHIHQKVIGFEKEYMDEHTLICFSFWGRYALFWLALSLDDYCQIKIRVNWCLCAGQKERLFCWWWCCTDIQACSIHLRPVRVTLTAHQRAIRRRGEEMRNCDGGKRRENLVRWERPKNSDRRSTYKELASKALHAIVAVILCKAPLACHINKVRSF